MRIANTERELRELLLQHGISATPQRLNIARLLFSAPRHVSAEQLIGELQDSGQRASKATVYNTLGLFSKLGLVRQVIADPDRVFYDSNTTPHQHLYNARTGILTDIGKDDVDVRVLANLPGNLEVEAIDVIIRVRQQAF